jgi:hypothetical protein
LTPIWGDDSSGVKWVPQVPWSGCFFDKCITPTKWEIASDTARSLLY